MINLIILTKMKKSLYIISLAVAVISAAFSFSSCSQTDAEMDKGKTPEVEYVRVCNPEAADSLLVRAAMGENICLMRSHLGDVQEVWFNDCKALLNPTMITSFSIIVTIPNQIPEDVTNEITLITSKGQKATFPFEVVVPAPFINSLSCEYARPGDVINIVGDYFIEPKVYFSGNSAPAEINSFDQQNISVVVPEGVVEGPIVIESIYGRSKSSFNFLDTTGMICNFDDGYVNPWGRGITRDDEYSISGNYILFETPAASAWGWNDDLAWGYWGSAETGRGNLPIAQGEISDLCLKFECNIDTWQDVPMLFWFQKWTPGGQLSSDDNYAQAHWKPWIKNGNKVDAATNGWITVSIPLSDFKYNKDESADNLTVGDITQYTDLNMMIFGAAEVTAPLTVRMDNFRIVKMKK